MKVEVFITRKQPNPEDIDFNNILKTILVPVHEGKQSFKWLGGVVAARIREEGGIPSEIDPEGSGDGIYNVFAIYNSKQVLINPSDKIFEHCLDAEIVTVYAEVRSSFLVSMHQRGLLSLLKTRYQWNLISMSGEILSLETGIRRHMYMTSLTISGCMKSNSGGNDWLKILMPNWYQDLILSILVRSTRQVT